MKNHVRRRNNKKLHVKLQLPKHLEVKLFSALQLDLGFTNDRDLEDDHSYRTLQPEPDGLLGAKRSMSASSIMKSVASFSPRCMVEDTVTREKACFFARYQLYAFLKKFPEKGIDTKTPALEKFVNTDQICERFNTSNFRALQTLSEKHPDFLGIVDEMRGDILSLLGEYPNLSTLGGLAKHGPGTANSSTLYKKGQVTSFFKWSSLPYTVTSSAVPLAKSTIASDPRWIGALDDAYRRNNSIAYHAPINMNSFWEYVLEVEDNSRLTTVPKTADIDRVIAIEPVMNVYLQLGVDGLLRTRLLKRWNIDINDQSRNQELAWMGSIDGSYATVDLSAASDRISLRICEMLLPAAWYNLLLDLRVAVTRFDKREHRLAKISSMGNGYTFALETLIFAAIARCANRRSGFEATDLSVFGDDIIVPTDAYPLLKQLLELAGFAINVDKTFTHGPFRESCGADYLSGTNVRPVFLKKELATVPDLFYLHNILIDVRDRIPWEWGYTFSKTLELIKRYIPQYYRDTFRGPPSQSYDTYLFVDNHKYDRNGCSKIKRIVPVPVVYRKDVYEDFFFRKLMASLKPTSDPFTFRRADLFFNQHRLRIKSPEPFYPKWMKKTSSSGNTFDITKRGYLVYKLSIGQVWKSDLLRHNSEPSLVQ